MGFIPQHRTGMLALAVCVITTPSFAITCNQGNQLVGGQWLATPYCQDEYLAQVGREHGFQASAERLRSNPNYKKELCRFVFSDIRVQEACNSAGVPEFFGGAR
jgi:hypothetical protein